LDALTTAFDSRNALHSRVLDHSDFDLFSRGENTLVFPALPKTDAVTPLSQKRRKRHPTHLFRLGPTDTVCGDHFAEAERRPVFVDVHAASNV